METQLLTVTEVAERLGLRHRAVRRAIARGEIPASRICSRIRVDPQELRGWIEGNRIQGSPQSDERELVAQ